MTDPMQITHRPDSYEQALDAVIRALYEIDDDSLPRMVAPGPDTVLIGEGGLSSLSFVTFAVTLEEELQHVGVTVSVMDVAAQESAGWTAGRLAARIAASFEQHPH